MRAATAAEEWGFLLWRWLAPNSKLPAALPAATFKYRQRAVKRG